MCVSHMGDFIVSGGHDRSLHLYKRTEEQVFIEEERELEQEQQIDQELDEQYKNPNIVYDEPEEEEKKEEEKEKVVELSNDLFVNGETVRAADINSTAIKNAEGLITMIQRAEEERKKRDEWLAV